MENNESEKSLMAKLAAALEDTGVVEEAPVLDSFSDFIQSLESIDKEAEDEVVEEVVESQPLDLLNEEVVKVAMEVFQEKVAKKYDYVADVATLTGKPIKDKKREGAGARLAGHMAAEGVKSIRSQGRKGLAGAVVNKLDMVGKYKAHKARKKAEQLGRLAGM